MNDHRIKIFISYSFSTNETLGALQKHRELLTNLDNSEATWLEGDFSSKHLEFAVEDFLANKNKNKLAIIHFCGHGYLDSDAGICIAKWDANQATQRKVLSLEWLNKLANRYSMSEVLTVLDCHFPKALNTNDRDLINKQIENSITPAVFISTSINNERNEKQLLAESSTCSNLHRQYVKRYLEKYLSNRQDRLHPVDVGISILEGFSRPDLPQKELFSEYYQLSILLELSEKEEERIDEILALAEEDKSFAELLSKVDELVYQELGTKASQDDYKTQIDKAFKLINMELYEAELSDTEGKDNHFDDFPIPIPKKLNLNKLARKPENQKKSKNGDNAIERYLTESNESTATKGNLYQLASEYYCLSVQSELSETEEERMDVILALAEEDNNFAELIRKVDPLIYQKLGTEASQEDYKIQIDKAAKLLEEKEENINKDEVENLEQEFSTIKHSAQSTAEAREGKTKLTVDMKSITQTDFSDHRKKLKVHENQVYILVPNNIVSASNASLQRRTHSTGVLHDIAETPDQLVDAGLRFARQQIYDEALVCFELALKLRPNHQPALKNRALTYVHLGLTRAALVDLYRLIDLDPKNLWAYANRAIIFRDLGHYGNAISDFGHLIKHDRPKRWQWLISRGSTLKLMGHYDEALQDFNLSLKLKPNNSWAISARDEMVLQLGGTLRADSQKSITSSSDSLDKGRKFG